MLKKAGKTYQFDGEWLKAGTEFALANMNVLMLRIYLRRTFSNSKEYETFKEQVIAAVQLELDELANIGM